MLLPSFAKINWILKILGKRPDGYHELRTVLQTVSLSDRLSFQSMPGTGVELEVKGRPAPADDSNLICRAAQLLRPSARRPCGVKVVLEKRIPLGAGLGGGSSNAAVSLMAFNQIWDCRCSFQLLQQFASQIGSDVPFFLLGGTASASGRGEVLQQLPGLGQNPSVLLLFPGLEISAAQAYSLGNWGPYKAASVLTRERAETKIQRFCLAAHSRQGLWSVVENDFEAPLYKLYPALRKARQDLLEAGCKGTLISGSGSTVLGLGDAGQMEGILHRAEQRKAGELFLCRTLSRQQYWKRLFQGGLEDGQGRGRN